MTRNPFPYSNLPPGVTDSHPYFNPPQEPDPDMVKLDCGHSVEVHASWEPDRGGWLLPDTNEALEEFFAIGEDGGWYCFDCFCEPDPE